MGKQTKMMISISTADFMKGIFAVIVNIAAITASRLEYIEHWLRIASLIIGISVGIATLISYAKGKK